ncbi:MAG: hypothetical protein PHN78_01400 [Dehalococcoidales bacterium]|nr:hypothetical protein [Dehalococcoidales bacterium]
MNDDVTSPVGLLRSQIRSSYSLGRILGVRIRLHYTWAFAFALIIAIVITQYPEAYPLWQRIMLGIAASLLFLTAVSIRQLILNFVGIRRGISVSSITLFAFGGVPQAEESTLPILELLMAATGLLSNLGIAGLFYGIHLILVNTGNVMIAGITQWLAFFCFMLALFHCLPGFPLDGGRALLALLWKVTDNYHRAMRITTWTG